tara:strand:+ start:3592 stop:5166 length:1575 start_codon:yes stop_codon:yes gene_type:complete
MSGGDVENIASLSKKITKIDINSVGTTGFGAAVGVLSVCVLTAIILGSISLNESNSSATQNINKITANFETGDPTSTGAAVTLVGDKYQVSLDYSNTATTSYIQYLNNVNPGNGAARRALVLDTNSDITTGVQNFTAGIFQGQLGGPTVVTQNPAYISGLSVTNGSYLGGILVSGDLGTNVVTGTNSAVIGGYNNTVSGSSSAIVGGEGNNISDISSRSFIGGGQGNGVCGNRSGTVGGQDNSVLDNSTHSFIGGGLGNGVCGNRSGTVGGQSNNILDNSTHSFIGGGEGVGVSGNWSGTVGGQSNSILSTHTAILGGKGLSTAPGGSWDYATLCGVRNDPTFFPWDKITTTHGNKGTCYRFAVGAGDANAGNTDLGFAVDDVGNLYFGNNSGGCSIFVQNASAEYTAKSFTIQHPTVPNRWLRHGCLEGPEGGVYYRGKGEAPATIRLPDYATHIASDFTVQVTPIGSPRMMSASEVSQEGTFRVYGEGKFHWNAIGERVPLEVEPLKTDVRIHSMGPYSWSV